MLKEIENSITPCHRHLTLLDPQLQEVRTTGYCEWELHPSVPRALSRTPQPSKFAISPIFLHIEVPFDEPGCCFLHLKVAQVAQAPR